MTRSVMALSLTALSVVTLAGMALSGMTLSVMALSVMAGRVPATHPRPVGLRRTLYNRRCAGGRDTLGHDDPGGEPMAHDCLPLSNWS